MIRTTIEEHRDAGDVVSSAGCRRMVLSDDDLPELIPSIARRRRAGATASLSKTNQIRHSSS